MTKSVYLSPSTQEANVGKGAYGTEETRMNQVTDITEKILKEHGVTVFRNKATMTLKELVVDSNSKKPTIHFAIHTNAGGGGRGCEVYCHRFGGEGEKLARALYKQIEPLTPSADRGVKEGCNHFGAGKPLYELAKTTAPAALIEIAFHDNIDDAAWILNNMELVGIALAKGVLSYFGIAYIPPKVVIPKKTPTKYYLVQVGAYIQKASAIDVIVKLKKAGFDGIIKEEIL